jgi:dehydrogenase/reductase SDR family protein 12
VSRGTTVDPTLAARWLDGVMEATVVPSFTRLGPLVRHRSMAWSAPPRDALRGKRVVLTGGTAGIGRAAAIQLAALGAQVVILGRDPTRGAEIIGELGGTHRFIAGDLTDLDEVQRVAANVLETGGVDVVVHNAGAMFRTMERTPQGIERNLAVHVIAPFLLTSLCLPALRETRGRVIVVTSGGMYTRPLDVERLRDPSADYRGSAAYARAKRAQVSLVEKARPILAEQGVEIAAMHPGWADTPGLRDSLPRFGRLLGPLLRSAAEGADTITWLAAAPAATLRSGVVFLDRAPRATHRLARTRASDTAAARDELWRLCVDASLSATGAERCDGPRLDPK